jgi:hypothetical protein
LRRHGDDSGVVAESAAEYHISEGILREWNWIDMIVPS